MDYMTFLGRVISDGVTAAEESYRDHPEKPKNEMKRRGAVAGFRACDGKTPGELLELLGEANRRAQEKFEEDDYWEHRCFALEVEWTCNVVSAMMANEGKNPIVAVTARGMMKASEILGVASARADAR